MKEIGYPKDLHHYFNNFPVPRNVRSNVIENYDNDFENLDLDKNSRKTKRN